MALKYFETSMLLVVLRFALRSRTQNVTSQMQCQILQRNCCSGFQMTWKTSRDIFVQFFFLICKTYALKTATHFFFKVRIEKKLLKP